MLDNCEFFCSRARTRYRNDSSRRLSISLLFGRSERLERTVWSFRFSDNSFRVTSILLQRYDFGTGKCTRSQHRRCRVILCTRSRVHHSSVSLARSFGRAAARCYLRLSQTRMHGVHLCYLISSARLGDDSARSPKRVGERGIFHWRSFWRPRHGFVRSERDVPRFVRRCAFGLLHIYRSRSLQCLSLDTAVRDVNYQAPMESEAAKKSAIITPTSHCLAGSGSEFRILKGPPHRNSLHRLRSLCGC